MVALTCIVTVIFVFIYMNGIETNRKQLLSLPKKLPITARILNSNGSLETGLDIPEELIKKIKKLGYAKNLRCTIQMAAVLPSAPDLTKDINVISVMGANDIRAVPNIDDRKVKLADKTNVVFLHGNDAQCLAGESFLQRNNLSIGDTVHLKLYMLEYDQYGSAFSYKPLGNCSLHIVGSISSTLTNISFTRIDILCPLGWTRKMHVQAGFDFHLDSTSFTVADPLNLNKFKAGMQQYLKAVNPLSSASHLGNSMTVKDETFVSTAGRLKSTLNVLYTFAPIVIAVIVLIGYAMSYLLMQSRRVDIAIMRSLGTSRKACVMTTLIEYAVLGLSGSILGTAGAALWVELSLSTLLYAMLFFASLMLGISVAAIQISRSNTMTGLIKTES
ncbi:MAG TPA: FtsX-like permease family protein [Clostridia bacterium]|nr:FtsX-like permease family protein [Clostridia bacterium]